MTTPAVPEPLDACVKCIKCRRCCGACDCTGGPQVEPECTCYELTGGHQPGCYFNRRPAPEPTLGVRPRELAGQFIADQCLSYGPDFRHWLEQGITAAISAVEADHAATVGRLEALGERVITVADECLAPFPRQTAEEALSCIEQGFYDYRLELNRTRRNLEDAEVNLRTMAEQSTETISRLTAERDRLSSELAEARRHIAATSVNRLDSAEELCPNCGNEFELCDEEGDDCPGHHARAFLAGHPGTATTAGLFMSNDYPKCVKCGSVLIPRPVGNIVNLECVNCRTVTAGPTTEEGGERGDPDNTDEICDACGGTGRASPPIPGVPPEKEPTR